ncbi:hypothetical protein E8E13_000788 [Curvularia kusanoi]|uniref:Uncharacterized protein n=1 Tax=Curvularia kusanoi TaxID=90978 RepID=A0A9P4W3D1_CURKU|nr:hypothetical protein E8E13_000788 [Curvularia kusanoi]
MSDDQRLMIQVPLPQSLKACRQSVAQDRIHISHYLKIELYVCGNLGEIHCLSSRFPYDLAFPFGTIFDSKGVVALSPNLQQIAQGVLQALPALPSFGEHYSDPIYRPGLLLRTDESHVEDLVHTHRRDSDCYTQLSTTQTRHFVFPAEFATPAEYDRPILA